MLAIWMARQKKTALSKKDDIPCITGPSTWRYIQDSLSPSRCSLHRARARKRPPPISTQYAATTCNKTSAWLTPCLVACVLRFLICQDFPNPKRLERIVSWTMSEARSRLRNSPAQIVERHSIRFSFLNSKNSRITAAHMKKSVASENL